jgi:hypothetical protein
MDSLLVLHWELAWVLSADVFTEHGREEGLAYSFVIFIKILQDEQGWNGHEYDCVSVIYLLLEGFILLTSGFNDRGEVEELLALLSVDEVVLSLLPRWLKVHESLDQVSIILELWINSFYILLILPE